jgi:hypothetical protein
MVSAVSSQAATLNPLAYTALDGDDNSKQFAPSLDAIAVDEGIRIARIEEADHVNVILEVGVERVGARNAQRWPSS